MDNLYIFDAEVFAYDWLFGFKNKATKEYTFIHNDNEAIQAFMERQPLLAGFNSKNYDQFIMRAVLAGFTPEEVKALNDYLIAGGQGWDYEPLRRFRFYFDQYDLMDDCQSGLSLKAIEAHLGMDIRETTIPFDIDRPLTDEELDEVIFYNKHDLDATDQLDDLRKDYLGNKVKLGEEAQISPERALYMTNAKLTASYLRAMLPVEPYTDEREYVIPSNLKTEYIPSEVFQFFAKIHDKSIPDEVVFKGKLDIDICGCPCTVAYGGIHGAIPTYQEVSDEKGVV